ncbi:MAG: sulfatase-like hydrolase/transferase, partial [Planctomycetota bacterium]
PVVLPPEAEFERLFYDEVETELRDEASRSYAAELRWQDRNLGALFRGLDGLGALDSSLLAITSDHGQGLGDGLRIHGWGAHRMLYREQVHVPLILRGPGVPAGARIPAQVRTADIAPTLLELAGLDPEPILGKYIAGESLVPLLAAGAPAEDRVAYGEQVSGYDDNAGMRVRRPDAAFLYMVSDGEWKVIYRPHMPENSELFHVSIDPREERNVRERHPEHYLRLMEDLARRNPWVLEPFSGPGGYSKSGQLGGLGYTAVEQGSGSWWWTCPSDPDIRKDARDVCPDCGRTLVPAGTWTEPK